MRYKEFIIEGRNAVLEAFRAGKTIDNAGSKSGMIHLTGGSGVERSSSAEIVFGSFS